MSSFTRKYPNTSSVQGFASVILEGIHSTIESTPRLTVKTPPQLAPPSLWCVFNDGDTDLACEAMDLGEVEAGV